MKNIRTFSLSYCGYNDQGILLLSGAGQHEGANIADVEYRLRQRLHSEHKDVSVININNHGEIL